MASKDMPACRTKRIMRANLMNDETSQSQFAAFTSAVKQRSAARILELGTEDSSFMLEMVNSVDWASNVELHCTEAVTEGFDQDLVAAAETTAVEFKLIKHAGSESELNDAFLELATPRGFDAVFISNSPSKEALLTSLLVCHELLETDGVLGLSQLVVTNPLLSDAIASFRDILGDIYKEASDHIFLKG